MVGDPISQESGLSPYILLDANIYDWPEVTCLLSPWKIAATTIQMQLQLKQLGRALGQESTREAASASLDRLTSMLFHHIKTSEEASYVGEMARGADIIVASRVSCFMSFLMLKLNAEIVHQQRI